MTSPLSVDAGIAAVPGRSSEAASRPPGDRYFRHPGDVVRLVLAGSALLLLVLFVELATSTSRGVSADLGRAATAVPDDVRELLLAVTQIVALAFPIVVLVAILVRQRWRRLGVVVLAAGAGAGLFALLDAAVRHRRGGAGCRDRRHLGGIGRFPSLTYVAGAAAVVTAGKPWLSRSWRRSADLSCGARVVLAVAGTAGVPELLVAVAAGVTAGAAVLVAFGAPTAAPHRRRCGRLARRRIARRRARARAGRRWAGAALLRHARRRRACVREGVRPRQPRRRSPLPRISHRAAARPERRLAGDDARAGRRARGPAAAHR